MRVLGDLHLIEYRDIERKRGERLPFTAQSSIGCEEQIPMLFEVFQAASGSIKNDDAKIRKKALEQIFPVVDDGCGADDQKCEMHAAFNTVIGRSREKAHRLMRFS